MRNKSLRVLALSILITTIYSCHPNDDIYIEDLDTVTTLYEEADFVTAPSKVIINWDVTQIRGEDGDDITYLGEIDDEILNTTLDNLVELYGEANVFIYTTAATPNPVPSNPEVAIITENDVVPTVDAAIVPSIILRLNTETSIIYPPCLPGWWYWFCFPPIIDVNTSKILS